MYKITLQTAGKEYIESAETIDLVLEGLGLEWHDIKAKGIIKVENGKQSYEHLFYLKQLRRIFGNKLTRGLWAKRLQILLEAK